MKTIYFIIIIGFISCNSNVHKENKVISYAKGIENPQEIHERAFKSWLKDSLLVIKSNSINEKVPKLITV